MPYAWARAVPRGHVHGADVEPDMIAYLAERARREGLANLSGRAGGRLYQAESPED